MDLVREYDIVVPVGYDRPFGTCGAQIRYVFGLYDAVALLDLLHDTHKIIIIVIRIFGIVQELCDLIFCFLGNIGQTQLLAARYLQYRGYVVCIRCIHFVAIKEELHIIAFVIGVLNLRGTFNILIERFTVDSLCDIRFSVFRQQAQSVFIQRFCLIIVIVSVIIEEVVDTVPGNMGAFERSRIQITFQFDLIGKFGIVIC